MTSFQSFLLSVLEERMCLADVDFRDCLNSGYDPGAEVEEEIMVVLYETQEELRSWFVEYNRVNTLLTRWSDEADARRLARQQRVTEPTLFSSGVQWEPGPPNSGWFTRNG